MEISKLSGDNLNHWVAIAQGWVPPDDSFITEWKKANGIEKDEPIWLEVRRHDSQFWYSPPEFYKNWSEAGRIIQRLRISIDQRVPGIVHAYTKDDHAYSENDDPLEAVLRVYLKSKFGDTVPG